MPIKTMHLTNYWHERSGGIATFYRHLLAAAERQHRRMILVVPGERDEIEEMRGCRIYKLASPRSPLNHEYRTIYPREFLFSGSKLQQILADEHPDLVEICDKYTLIYLGLLLRLRLARALDFRPVVVGLTCERMDENVAAYVIRSSWGQAFARFYMRHSYFPAFDHHIAISDHTADELRAIANGHLVPRGVWIRPMGVDTTHFSPDKRCPQFRSQLLARCGCPQNAVPLLYVGRLAPEKNLDLLITTMAELAGSAQDFRLLLGGEGIARSTLEHAAQALAPGKVVFLGHIGNREELARLYASCDVFVHPNPAEPFGIAPLEAMASGLALVAPDRGGVTSYANDSNSYLSPPVPADFAEAILRASQASAERIRKVQAARKTAEMLSWPEVTESFLRLYDELYRQITDQQPIETVAPAFVSSPADASRTRRLRFASQLAQKSFLGYAAAQRLAASIFGKRSPCQTELKDLQSQ